MQARYFIALYMIYRIMYFVSLLSTLITCNNVNKRIYHFINAAKCAEYDTFSSA